MPFLHIICALSVAALILCLWKIHDLRRGAEELRTEFAARLSADTNVGIDISTSDKNAGLGCGYGPAAKAASP